MRRIISFLLYYKGFLLAGVLALAVVGFYVAGERAIRTEGDRPQTGPLKFLTLAWQVEAVQAVQEITAEWNQLHPELPVELNQGNWSAIHDYLITGFETGDIPDIFHYESATIVDFALRGYLADLAPYISPEMRSDILDVNWSSVQRSSGEIVGVPFLSALSSTTQGDLRKLESILRHSIHRGPGRIWQLPPGNSHWIVMVTGSRTNGVPPWGFATAQTWS